MPSWGVHLKIASLVTEKINVKEKDKFFIGNIMPDINNAYVVHKIHKTVDHKTTHFGGRPDFKNYETFFDKYHAYLENEYVLGYLVHILTDRFFNNIAYSEKGIFNEKKELIGITLNNGDNKICNMEQIRKIKTNDFRILSKYIYNNYALPKIYYSDDVLEVNDIIEEIELTKEDVERIIEYLNSHTQDVKKVNDIFRKMGIEKYRIFTEEELLEDLKLCTDFIVNYLKSKNVLKV